MIAGVAFLGAGAIIHSGGQVGGLTTDTSLWMSGTIGVAAGGGFITLAANGVVFAVIVLIVVGSFEARVINTMESSPPVGGDVETSE